MFQDKIIHQTYKIHFIIRIIVTIIYRVLSTRLDKVTWDFF